MAEHTLTCKCGSTDFKEIKENVLQTYKACKTCGYSFAMEKAEINLTAGQWVESLQSKYTEANEALRKAELRLNEKDTNLTIALKNAAERELARIVLQLEVANLISKIVETTEEGQITLLIPEVGKYTFEWGDFKLFKVLGEE